MNVLADKRTWKEVGLVLAGASLIVLAIVLPSFLRKVQLHAERVSAMQTLERLPPNLMAIVTEYRNALASAGRAIPEEVPIRELVSAGYLKLLPVDASTSNQACVRLDMDSTKFKAPLVYIDLRDGTAFRLVDGSVIWMYFKG